MRGVVTCVFCRILARQAPGSFVLQTTAVSAFLDLFPVNPGHLLVVPNAHVADLEACPSDIAGELFRAAKQLSPLVKQATGATGFNVWTANGAAAGQEVFHLHLHVLPRFTQNAFGLRFPKNYPTESARGALDAMATTIRRLLEQ